MLIPYFGSELELKPPKFLNRVSSNKYLFSLNVIYLSWGRNLLMNTFITSFVIFVLQQPKVFKNGRYTVVSLLSPLFPIGSASMNKDTMPW